MLEGKIITETKLKETLQKYKDSHNQISQKIAELNTQQLQLAGAILAVTDQLENIPNTKYEIHKPDKKK